MIEVSGLAVYFGDALVASVPQLAVSPGEIVGLAGESGAGKTTVALAVLGLAVRHGATVTGRVTVDGRPPESALSQGLIGYVPQHPQAALPPATRVGALLAAALRRHRVPRGDRQGRVAAAVRTLGLEPELLRRYPHQLSGGQAQRIAIALPLALRARYLVVDEPTSALDRVNQLGLVAELRRLRDTAGTGVLVVSHDLGVLSAVADRAVVMWRSRVVEQGSLPDLLTSPVHPQTRELVAAAGAVGRGRSAPDGEPR